MIKYNIQYNIGKVKYLLSYHDGIKKHNDGSEFYDIKTFNNKKKLNEFIKELEAEKDVKINFENDYFNILTPGNFTGELTDKEEEDE